MTKLVDNHVITDEILGNCIYSCNKKAKNCRDMKRSSRRGSFKHQYYELEEKSFYQMKDSFLSILKPVCIHIEIHEPRWYDPDPEYDYRYYELYSVGGFSFHHPIAREAIDPNLPVVELDSLITTGRPANELLSTQFCTRVLNLIKSDQYTYIPSSSHSEVRP
jgi:hypothetical protein